ncbi:2-C-methyl-D-erythritol 4-phosphate cytidylyltransferase [Fusobacterium sp. SB021]|uniref:2-C-methyl-D-erythritol 4-phosphate cytidylyltransferase n=1 Tax=Fusobacterium sp. SB021 TaxID=2744227 RepID=UPI003CEAE9F2
MFSSNSEIRYTLIVAAAGVGKRMGLSYPKQFLEHNGKPLFINVLEIGEKSKLISDIIIVTGKELKEEVKNMCEKFKITKVKEIVEGGKERQDSIYNALKFCDKNSIIAVQDGVRPFFKEKYLEDAFNELKNNPYIDGVVVGVPVKDTIKVVNEEGIIISTPVRRALVAAQTPQVFRGKILIEAYEKAKEENFLGTDDSSLVEKYGGKVKISLGDYGNIKITTIEDISFLKREGD